MQINQINPKIDVLLRAAGLQVAQKLYQFLGIPHQIQNIFVFQK